MNSLKATGFHKVRLESFAGGHDIYQPHIGEALKWFVAEAGKQNPATTPKDSFGSSIVELVKANPFVIPNRADDEGPHTETIGHIRVAWVMPTA
jgi:hypothetical protein